jgi:hypothetical protein
LKATIAIILEKRSLKNHCSVIPAEEPESGDMSLINEMPDQVRHDKVKEAGFSKVSKKDRILRTALT